MNFDLPLTGTERVELHIHSGGQVFLGSNAPERALPPIPLGPSPARGTALPVRLLTHTLVGVVCLVAGVALAPRPHLDDARIAAAWPTPHPAPVLRLPTPPLLPIARSRSAVEASDQDVQEPSLPSATDMPEAVARQLAQPPVVTPPAASPRAAPGGSAFGLDN